MNGIVEIKKMKRVSFFKRSARKLLYSQWITQVLAFLIVGSCFVGVDRFGLALASIAVKLFETQHIAELLRSVYIVFDFVLFIPILYGLVCFEIKALDEKADLSLLFCAFGDAEKLSRAYTLFFYTLVRCLVSFLPAIAVGVFLERLYFSGIFGIELTLYGVDIVRLCVTAFFALSVYLGFVLSSRNFAGIYVSILRSELPLKECFFIANACIHTSGNTLVGAALSFLPLCVLSLFTVGFLFVMYTFPYMLITFVMISKYLFDVEMSKKTASQIMYKTNDINENE